MSTIFKDRSTADSMPSHIDTGCRLFGSTVGKTTFWPDLEPQDYNGMSMQLRSGNDLESMPDRTGSRVPAFERISLHNRLNQDLRLPDHVNASSASTASRTFGLQSRNPSSISSFHQEDKMKLNPILDGVHHRSNISTVSKTFGLISEDLNGLNAQDNRRYNQNLRGNYSGNPFSMTKLFGLRTKTLTSQSDGFSQGSSKVNQDINIMNFRSTVSRTCSGSENLGGLISNDNEEFNQNLKRNICVDSSVMLRPLGLQSRNLTLNRETGLKLNQDSALRGNNTSAISKTFGPAIRKPTGFSMQENSRHGDDVIDNGGFRRPTLSRVIRGRSSILTSRLFQNQNTKQCSKDLSNINGFNVSHISLRDVDSQSDSRLAFNARNNWMDNQSMSGSILSATSMKSQFINLLENLHHSVLNIGPRVTAEAVRLEFDRAKQKVESISEMSFAPSLKENGAASVINQSSKYICPPLTEPTTSFCIDGGSLHLKSSKDLLKSLTSGKDSYRGKFNLTTHVEEEERGTLSTTSSSQIRKSNEESVFKKPVPLIKNNKKRKSSRILKINTSEAVKSVKSGATNKVINLKQWYPIAFGSDLALCGVDEEGATVRTDPVKKRLNNRKVELINGLCCNLTGSPSSMVSVLPQKIITLLKNGLTDRWRVLQKELLNCQRAEEDTKKRVSKSPNVRSSPEKKERKRTPKEKTNIQKPKTPKTPKIISTPKKKGKVAEVRTRSGRAIKPPSMFWIATGSSEVSSTVERSTSEIMLRQEQSMEKNIPGRTHVKKSKKTSPESPSKIHKNAAKTSPKKKGKTTRASTRKLQKGSEESKTTRKIKASPGKNKKGDESLKCFRKEEMKGKIPKKNKRTESEVEGKVHSFTEDAKRENKGRKVQRKRKTDVNDAESVQAKKTKIEKKGKFEVESSLQTGSEPVLKGEKRNKNRFTLGICSPKPKGRKSPAKKKKETVKKKAIKNVKAREINELEDDFNDELELDDIKIPEISNVSGNPQLRKSQLRSISMETPPLKYFNTHLNLVRSETPVKSPNWCISQRTESEVKQFQKRREEAFKKKIKLDIKKTVITEKSKNFQNRDVKRVMEWVAEKTVRSPRWNSKVLQYVIPSRKQLEERMNDEDDEDVETEFF